MSSNSSTTSQERKEITTPGGAHLSSQLLRKSKYEDCGPGQPGHNCEIVFEKYLKLKELEVWLEW
jgi:hypothetical protein